MKKVDQKVDQKVPRDIQFKMSLLAFLHCSWEFEHAIVRWPQVSIS